MGKVFDALEKFRGQQKASLPGDDPKTSADEQAEARNDSLNEAEEHVEHSTIDEDMIALIKPQSFEAEQFKILRTKLLFPASGNPARSIMVTSAVPGDGLNDRAAYC